MTQDNKFADDKSEKIVDGLIKIYEKRGLPAFLKTLEVVKPILTDREHQYVHKHVTQLQEQTADKEYVKRKLKDISSLFKENGGDGGGFGGTVATSADSGFFTPTYGSNKKKKKYEQKAIPSQNTPTSNEANLKKALDQRHMENDTPKVSEFPSEMDNTAVEAEQEFVMQVEQLKDGERKDKRSRESAISDSVDPSAATVSLKKDLDTIIEEVYHGRTTSIQKIMHLLKDDNT